MRAEQRDGDEGSGPYGFLADTRGARALRAFCTAVVVSTICASIPVAALAAELESELGRNEVRVYAQPLRIGIGDSVIDLALARRLDLLEYRRVHRRPQAPGEYFWGFTNFWIFQRASGAGSSRAPAGLLQLELERATARVTDVKLHASSGLVESRVAARIEALLLAESLTEARAPRRRIELEQIPEHVWRSVLAIEDARFFSHGGVDPRSVARAMLKNAKAGRVTQGGSTITQQLVKMRDLSPRRTMGRKVSEALRALALEAEFDKRDILEAYLDSVYMGHVGGVAVYGIGAAARAYFSKPVRDLDVGESALLAGMIQGPNRLHPKRHPERAIARQRAVLERLEDLRWVDASLVARARRRGLPALKLSTPKPLADRQVLAWIAERVAEEAPRRSADAKGFIVRTTIDPLLQEEAERAVREGLATLRGRSQRLRRSSLSAALVALDARTGAVLAYVAGDPADRQDAFDRARSARRQPGSAVKPFVLLEALESCGDREPLHSARRVLDAPLSLRLESGLWQPENSDGRYRGGVSLRQATIESLNVPFVRLARHCGFEATAGRFRRAGLDLSPTPPASFALGAVEASPLEMAAAYTVFSSLGDRLTPEVLARLERPSGRRVFRSSVSRRRVSRPATAYIVRELLRQTVERGTAMPARLAGHVAIGKTGTSSGRRDAWFVGSAGAVVTAVWVGVDRGSALGSTGAGAAAPIWREFMQQAAAVRGEMRVAPPLGVVERWVDARTGLRISGPGRSAERHVFRRGHEPRRKRVWRRSAEQVIE